MGCWNETCALTRLPIRYGQPTVELTAVVGANYRQSSMGGFKNSLFYGLPLVGQYDDYGGIESFENSTFAQFQKEAFNDNLFYRHVEYSKPYGSKSSIWIAGHPSTLEMETTSLKPLFFARDGIGLVESINNQYTSNPDNSKRYKEAQEALEALGGLLSTAEFGTTSDSVYGKIEEIFQQCFGKEQATMAYHLLSSSGLTIGRSNVLMHKVAYDRVVKDFSKRKIQFDRKSRPMREYFSVLLDEYLEFFAQLQKRSAANLAKDTEDPDESKRFHDTMFYLSLNNRRFEAMKPLSTLWCAPEAPLIGHYWGAREPSAIIQAAGRDHVLDFLVFQWARHYMRIDLVPAASGSQNRETKLMSGVYKATLSFLAKENQIRNDFEGTVY